MKRFESLLLFSVIGLLSLNTTSVFSHYNINSNFDNISINSNNDNDIDNMIISIANELRELKNNGASDEELNTYLNTKVFNQRWGLEDYITGNLNSLEQELYNSNKSNGILCMANGKLAIEYAESNYISSELHNGNGDAFRHILWNYGMVIDVGYDFAKKWSNAHENGSYGQPDIEKEMDLYNNSIGLNLGLQYPNTVSHSTFISNSKEKVRNGSAKRIVDGRLTSTNYNGEK